MLGAERFRVTEKVVEARSMRAWNCRSSAARSVTARPSSAEIDSAGTVDVTWSDCRFRRACKTNDLVLSHSLNSIGTSWSSVSRVPIDGTTSGIDHFIPGLAVNATTSGSSAQLEHAADRRQRHALDNCLEPTATFTSGLAGGTASSAADPVLFGGNTGNASSLWNVVDNNGAKHRD